MILHIMSGTIGKVGKPNVVPRETHEEPVPMNFREISWIELINTGLAD